MAKTKPNTDPDERQAALDEYSGDYFRNLRNSTLLGDFEVLEVLESAGNLTSADDKRMAREWLALATAGTGPAAAERLLVVSRKLVGAVCAAWAEERVKEDEAAALRGEPEGWDLGVGA